MSHRRRSMLAVAGAAGLAAPPAGAHVTLDASGITGQAVAELLQLSEEANSALLRGDVETYLNRITLSDDFTLMSPFGGTPLRGLYTAERWEEIGRFFRNGTLRQELVQAYGSTDLVVLAIIEHGHGEFGGLPAQDWPLRVTLVYRRKGLEWRLAHRHADPLVKGITLQQLATLARSGTP